MLLEAEEKLAFFEAGFKEMEEVYKQTALYYCEDPTKAASDEIGKKLLKCILFVDCTEKIFADYE